MSNSATLAQREADALVNMMAADGRRIDDLVGAFGEVRGDVSHLRGDVGRVVKGVDELKDAMIGVARHAVLLETQQRDSEALRQSQRETNLRVSILEGRIAVIETAMPQLIETRAWTVRAGLAVCAAVGLALLALVVKR